MSHSIFQPGDVDHLKNHLPAQPKQADRFIKMIEANRSVAGKRMLKHVQKLESRDELPFSANGTLNGSLNGALHGGIGDNTEPFRVIPKKVEAIIRFSESLFPLSQIHDRYRAEEFAVRRLMNVLSNEADQREIVIEEERVQAAQDHYERTFDTWHDECYAKPDKHMPH